MSAPIDSRLRATLLLLRKLTLCPDEVGTVDIDEVRRNGVSDEAIRDAIHVCALFNIIDRVADAMGFSIPTDKEFARGAKRLLKRGYRL